MRVVDLSGLRSISLGWTDLPLGAHRGVFRRRSSRPSFLTIALDGHVGADRHEPTLVRLGIETRCRRSVSPLVE